MPYKQITVKRTSRQIMGLPIHSWNDVILNKNCSDEGDIQNKGFHLNDLRHIIIFLTWETFAKNVLQFLSLFANWDFQNKKRTILFINILLGNYMFLSILKGNLSNKSYLQFLDNLTLKFLNFKFFKRSYNYIFKQDCLLIEQAWSFLTNLLFLINKIYIL